MALSLFFLLLTQHPFPDPAKLRCPDPGTTPNFQPFAFVAGIADAVFSGNSRALLTVGPLSSAANLALCAIIGWAHSRRTDRLSHAVALGAGLTLAAELSQITGLWGVYPCPYRKFDVDDILLNVGGVVLGFLIGRWLTRR